MPGPSELDSMYNTTINENIIKAIEDRPLLIPQWTRLLINCERR